MLHVIQQKLKSMMVEPVGTYMMDIDYVIIAIVSMSLIQSLMRNGFHINSAKDINPRGKGQIRLKENPRKGICSWCGAIVGISCKRTCMHHMDYDEHDPLKYTIELCNSCHKREHDRIRFLQRAEHTH